MTTAKIKFNPANDTYITSLFLDWDEEGNFLDVETSVMHSEEHGYYLARTIVQVWRDRTWETAIEDEAEEAPRHHRRTIKVYRPLTPVQVIRLIVENSIPDEGGALQMTLSALDAAGIR
jgi:hypothetical protein